ncbi:outer membrane beta-barrel protein [Runella rosea]|nr:outer membrane beta-barrel protein [Runella rosea]
MKTSILQVICIVSVLFFISKPVSGQMQILGKVADKVGKPLSFANILVFNVQDSSFVKGDIAKEDGSFTIQNIKEGAYFCEVSMLGFSKKNTTFFQLIPQAPTMDLGVVALTENTELNTVEIVAKKPLFEQKIDRLVINVENSITSAGSTALDVLERSPGVMVNRQDNTISLSGKSGVVVMINGKLNYMSSDAAVQMLSGMSAGSIEKIELLSTPPSNLDAEGNAGYINILLKKNQNEGFSGSYAFTAGYGRGTVGNGSFNLNYRHKKITIYGSYDYVHLGQEQNSRTYRRIMLGNNLLETETSALRHPSDNNHNVRIGLDYQLDAKTMVSLAVSGFSKKYAMNNTLNESTLSRNNVVDTLIRLKINEVNLWKHVGASFGVQRILRENEALSFGVDYLHYDNDQPVNYNNTWFDGKNNLLFNQTVRSTKITPINFGIVKMDYSRDFGKKGKLEMGVKAVMSQFKNNVGVETLMFNAWKADPDFTAKYRLKESIGAAYTSYETKWGPKTTVKGGLRFEYTQSNLGSEEVPNIVDRKYGRLFPSLFLTHDYNKNKTLSFSYSRRITRPTFKDLAPFTFFIDPNTFLSGNAALQPAISDNLKADYRFKSTLFSLQYSYTSSPIAGFQARLKPGSNKLYYVAENQKNLQTYSLTIGQPYSPVKWWTTYTNLAGVFSVVNAYNNGYLVTVKFPNVTLYNVQTFSLTKKVTLEVSGYYNSGGLWGISKMKAFGELNVGLQKRMGKDGGKLSIGYDNIFNSSIYRINLNLPEQQQYFETRLQFTQPKFKISWSQNFGNQKMKAAAKRAEAEEKARVE